MKIGDRLGVPYWILLIEVLFFYRQVLFYDGFVIPWDLRHFHLPHASFIAECFRNGELPGPPELLWYSAALSAADWALILVCALGGSWSLCAKFLRLAHPPSTLVP